MSFRKNLLPPKFVWTMILLALALSFNLHAKEGESNVILLMLDGVRWQEVFHGTDPELDAGDSEPAIFPNLFQELGNSGFVTGDKELGNEMTVSNSMLVSLPAYQSIMAGSTQSCLSNYCGRIGVETFEERLVRELGWAKEKVATISSWATIANAVEHVPGRTFVNSGLVPLNDGTVDRETDAINVQQKKEIPSWGDARLDKFTFAHAMNYLKKHRPRFMFISLNDSDEWGHKGEYKKYVETLRQYDSWISQLVQTLKQMGEYGQSTTLIVTTDHGRGLGQDWRNHSFFSPESKFIWLFGKNPGVKGNGGFIKEHYSHIDIRPTIEALLGLSPLKCKECGKVITELVPNP